MIESTILLENLYQESLFLDKDFLIILGPTASGKTKLAVQLAKAFDAEIISADSRQVYRYMDIGTGKDIPEYGDVAYHLIDIIDPGEQYNVNRFMADFDKAFQSIKARDKRVIVCGGTGFYLQALLVPQPYNQIPTNKEWRQQQELKSKEEIEERLSHYAVPEGYLIDYSSKKRMVRALEILEWLSKPNNVLPPTSALYQAKVIGLNPDVNLRRDRITRRLHDRLEAGLIDEVKKLLESGLSYEELEYYGLEYKYSCLYLKGALSYDEFVKKLETEIHRYAKRQMTYFRKMEKDGVQIQWV